MRFAPGPGWLLAALGVAACARPAQPKPATQAEIAPPAPTLVSPPTPSAPRDDRKAERERLEAACFAEPWVTADPKLGPKPLSPATAERLRVLEKECRDTHPELPPGRFASPEAIPPSECHYGIARIYFEEQHYVEAARWFRRVATEDQAQDIGVFAAQLYLEALDVLWIQGVPQRLECKRLLVDDAREFACTYCPQAGAQEPCTIFRRVGEEANPGQPAECPP